MTSDMEIRRLARGIYQCLRVIWAWHGLRDFINSVIIIILRQKERPEGIPHVIHLNLTLSASIQFLLELLIGKWKSGTINKIPLEIEGWENDHIIKTESRSRFS